MKLLLSAVFSCVMALSIWPTSMVRGANVEPMMYPDNGPWGLVIHTPYRAEALRSLGVQWVRLSLRWNLMEPMARGQYDWQEADKMIHYYHREGFGMMCVLAVEDLSPAYKDEKNNQKLVIEAIKNWCAAAADRYKGMGILWELSNEPEVFPMGGYWNNPQTYARMTVAASAAIKKADPDCKVAAFSVAWMDRDFITAGLNAGALAGRSVDIVSYHGYHRKDITPESGLSDDLQWLRNTIARFTPAGKSVIPVDSERGYGIMPEGAPKPNDNWRNFVHCESAQAAYLARHYLESISLGIELIVWYKDMFGETEYSLYYTDENNAAGLRPMGHVYRNLAKLLPDNPKKLQNDLYPVSYVLASEPGVRPANRRVFVRSYLQRHENGSRLIVALWNPIEAFDRKMLESREFVDKKVIEKWRPITDSDVTELPCKTVISGIQLKQVKSAKLYHLLAHPNENLTTEITLESDNETLRTPTLKIGPMPTVLVIDL